ncbi:hypothetical protein C8J25_101870 [Sphingomonas faeni]|uniref:Tail assembly chaperone n=1 Tax=Sphingomonas faeni TaxID=185950 RepID=A0A2T5UCW8_9SPHN|nr:hypothetical protein [Sphingomonas faeni]PTW49362.1 hypothetical protein C8J25_101870 [Sphingomonas faeni]
MAVLLSRAAILAAPVPTREVEVPEWGGTILVRSLSAKTRMQAIEAINERQTLVDAYEADQAKPEDEREGLAAAYPLDNSIMSVLFAIVDEELNPMFSMDDYSAFEDLSLPTLTHIFRQMQILETPTVAYNEQKKSSVSRRKGGSSSGSRSR